jgi:hypothetical protein
MSADAEVIGIDLWTAQPLGVVVDGALRLRLERVR